MNTPTPRTDRAVADSDGQWSFELRYCSRQLETELTAVTEQRDRLQLIVDEGRRVSSFCREYREQRDRLGEALNRIIEEDGRPMSMRVCSTKSLAQQALQSLNQPEP